MSQPENAPGSAEAPEPSIILGGQVHLREWSEAEFLSRREDYLDLLDRSDADRLFLSWDWLVDWWTIHKGAYGLRLRVFAAETEKGRILGLAPMTVRPFRHRGGVVGVRMEPLGNLAGTSRCALTEYVTFPVDRRESSPVTTLLARSLLAASDWDDLFLSFVPTDSDTWRILVDREAARAGVYVRPPDHLVARVLDLKGGYQAFLSGLGARTRRRIHHDRKRLARRGSVEFVVASGKNLEDSMSVLDRLHRERWGAPAFLGPRGALYREVVEKAMASGSLSLCYTAVDGHPLAAALNLRKDGREYGIQLAVRRTGLRNLSPGLIHLGFMIERCCEDGIRYFDFLAGDGGSTDYRRHFGGATLLLSAVHLVRTRKLALPYRSVDWLRRVQGRFRGVSPPSVTPTQG